MKALLRWQWDNYPGTHSARGNLIMHLVTVPLFWAGTLLLIDSLVRPELRLDLAGIAGVMLPVVAQGFGHKRLEPRAPAPFTSPWNFMARLVLEQWVTFPGDVLSGGWGRAFRVAR